MLRSGEVRYSCDVTFFFQAKEIPEVAVKDKTGSRNNLKKFKIPKNYPREQLPPASNTAKVATICTKSSATIHLKEQSPKSPNIIHPTSRSYNKCNIYDIIKTFYGAIAKVNQNCKYHHRNSKRSINIIYNGSSS